MLTGQMTVYSEGLPVVRETKSKGNARGNAVYQELVAAAQELLAVVSGCKGRTNKDNAKFTDQIRNLIRKWRQ